MSVLIIDYGMGNLASVRRALEECGATAFVSAHPDDINKASKIILPGVGSFAAAMENIHRTGWFGALQDVAKRNIPLLGICLGMQLLADEGEEHGTTKGLGLIAGRVQRFALPSELRIPHVGWNEIKNKKPDPLLAGVDDGTDFYFVHSFHFKTANDADIVATTPYGDDFTSIVSRGSVWGAQFHPEKSGLAGFQIIRNFLAIS